MKPVPAIKLQDDFQHFIDEFEVSYRDYNVTEAAWIKAEEAIYGKAQFKSEVDTSNKTEDVFNKESNALTQAELQYLTIFNSHCIHNIERCIYWDKMQVKDLWVTCDINDKTTKENFNSMKLHQNRIDKLKKELKFLVGIQKKIKHQRDNS